MVATVVTFLPPLTLEEERMAIRLQEMARKLEEEFTLSPAALRALEEITRHELRRQDDWLRLI